MSREGRTELVVADATVVEGVQVAGVDPQHVTVVVDGLRIPTSPISPSPSQPTRRPHTGGTRAVHYESWVRVREG